MDLKHIWHDRSQTQKVAIVGGAVLAILLLSATVLAMIHASRSNLTADLQMERGNPSGARYQSSPSTRAGDGAAQANSSGGAGEFEVHEGSMHVEAVSATSAVASFREITDTHSGYIQSTNRSTANTKRRIHIVARVPAARFAQYTEVLKEQFDAESFSVQNYRISVRRQQDEIDVLTNALNDYQDLTERAKQTELDTDQITILKELTQTQLDTVSELRRYQRQLAQQQDRSVKATFSATFAQTIPAPIWPDEIGNTFREKLADAVETAIMALIATVTGAIVVLARVVQFIVYALIVIIPVYAVYRGLRYLYKHVSGESADQ
jgi:hypothetical protein